MRMDYDVLNDRFLNLKDQYERLDADYQKDKGFYEEALEARMTQMEELEHANDSLTARLESSREREIDLQA